MRTKKRICLILLLFTLFTGALLLDPLVRFSLALRSERFDDAEAIFLSRLNDAEPVRQEAQRRLDRFVQAHLDRYLARQESFDRALTVLSALSERELCRQSAVSALQTIRETEKARDDLSRADAHFERGEYAQAIPLYALASAADDAAPIYLEQARTGYKNQVLEQAEAAMDAGEFKAAETILLDGQRVLGEDTDLSAALADAQRMDADRTYDRWAAEARELLQTAGPEQAFAYVDELRAQHPDAYALAFLEQSLFHEYEESVRACAQALHSAGDPKGAYALVEEGLRWIDSDDLKALRCEIGPAIPWPLEEMPVLRDETGNPQTGAASTVARDRSRMDALTNEYEHSFSADLGSVSFSLQKEYSLFTGTVAFPMGERSDIYRASATLEIWGDGKLMAEFKNVDGACAPVSFSLSLEGVDELTLRWTCRGANGWKDWGRFATIYDGKFRMAPALKAAP